MVFCAVASCFVFALPFLFGCKSGRSSHLVDKGWGKIGLRPRGVTDVHFPNPPPLLARRDGAMTTGIHSPPVPPLPPTVVVFYVRSIPVASHSTGEGGMQRPTMASRWQISLMQMSWGGACTCKHANMKT